MYQFWFEFLHFVASILAVLSCFSLSLIFFLTRPKDKTEKKNLRGFGYALLSITFLLYVLERKFPEIATVAVFMELCAFLSILAGVFVGPTLSKLNGTAQNLDVDILLEKPLKEQLNVLGSIFVWIIALSGLSYGLIVVNTLFLQNLAPGPYLLSIVTAFSTLAVLGIAVLKIRMDLMEKENSANLKLNRLAIFGFLFLFVRGMSLVLYRIPETNIVFFENLKGGFGVPWLISIAFTFLAFVFIGKWAWHFIKSRFFLRTFISFLSIASIVSSLGSLVFTILIFQIVEENNYKIMTEGAKTQYLVMEDRSNTALVLARSIANEQGLAVKIQDDEYYNLFDKSEEQLLSSGMDILRIYDSTGRVVVSLSDERDRNQVFEDDLLQRVLQDKKPIKSFDREPHVLSPLVIARGIYPIIENDEAVGAVEVGYKFDTAFVDFSKGKTGLDVTIYTDVRRSATTIMQQDGISRWIGTNETSWEVIKKVLTEGRSTSLSLDRLGENYYSAFEPIRNYYGDIIGMVSVGTPTYVLLEATRQQLLFIFLVANMISTVGAFIGYYIMHDVQFDTTNLKSKKSVKTAKT